MAAPFGREPRPGKGAGGDVLALWAERTGRRWAGVPGRGGLRFVFYGRVSTEDWQDPVTSRARQREQAAVLVAAARDRSWRSSSIQGRAGRWRGRGACRPLRWWRQLADPDRGWDAIVIGEYERAFYGSQYARWRRCSSITASSCGCRRWAAGSITTLSTTRRRCRAGAVSPSGRSPGPGSGSGPRWPPRPASRAGISAAVRRTGTGWLMPGRTRTRRTPHGAVARISWSPTRDGACRAVDLRPAAGRALSTARIARALNEAGVPCPSAADPKP